MDFAHSEHHDLLRKTVREFALKEVLPNARKWDEEERFPKEIVPKLAAMGLLGIRIPEEYGGSGMDMTSYAICVEEIARCDGSLALTVASHNGLGTGHILAFGNDAQKKKYLSKAARGEWLAAWALTEPGSGSDSAGLRTTARRDGDNWVLNGTKMFITQGSVGGFCVVLARTNSDVAKQKGITAFVVEHGTKGFTASKHLEKLGCRSSDTVELTFDEVVDRRRAARRRDRPRLHRHDEDPRPRSHLDRRDGARPRLRRSRDGPRVCEGPQAVQQIGLYRRFCRQSSGCSPT